MRCMEGSKCAMHDLSLETPSSGEGPTARMIPSLIATSPTNGSPPFPSTTIPPRMTRSAFIAIRIPENPAVRRGAGRSPGPQAAGAAVWLIII